MEVSPIYAGPQAENGSSHECIVPSNGEVFRMQGQSLGRSRKYCMPICLERIAFWNVEGLRGEANTKLFELRQFMKTKHIYMVCIITRNMDLLCFYQALLKVWDVHMQV